MHSFNFTDSYLRKLTIICSKGSCFGIIVLLPLLRCICISLFIATPHQITFQNLDCALNISNVYYTRSFGVTPIVILIEGLPKHVVSRVFALIVGKWKTGPLFPECTLIFRRRNNATCCLHLHFRYLVPYHRGKVQYWKRICAWSIVPTFLTLFATLVYSNNSPCTLVILYAF